MELSNMKEKLERARDAVERSIKQPNFKEYDFLEESVFWTNRVVYADGITANVNIKVRFEKDKK